MFVVVVHDASAVTFFFSSLDRFVFWGEHHSTFLVVHCPVYLQFQLVKAADLPQEFHPLPGPPFLKPCI